MDETNGILQSGIPGSAGLQQMTTLGGCRIQTNYVVSHYRLELAGPRVACFTLLSRTCSPLGLFFYKKKGAVGPAPKVWVRSLAAEGARRPDAGAQNMSAEYHLLQREINGRNRVQKVAFDQTG